MVFPYDQYSGDMFGQQEQPGQEQGQGQGQQQQQPQHPSAPGSFPQWETLSDQLQQPLHSPLDTPGSGTLPMQLELEDMHMAQVPSPIDNTPILLHHPHENPPPPRQRHAPATAGAPLHPIDAVIFGSSRPRSAASAASTPPGAGPSTSTQPTTTTAGVVRNPPRTRTASATAGASHPYYRPHTTGAGGAGTGAASSSQFMTPNPAAAFEPLASGTAAAGRRGSAVMTRSKTKKQTTTMSATTSHGGMIERPPARRSASGAAGASSSPTVRQSLFGSTSNSPHFVPHDVASSSSPGTPQVPQHYPSTTGTPPAPPPTGTSTTQAQAPQAHPSIPRHRLRQHTIPSDMHYSLPTHTLTCSLELPGVLPQHIRVSLATCFFNHVKYVAVSAESVPPFPEPVWGEDVIKGLRGERIWGVVGAGARSTSAGAGAGAGGEEHDRLKIGQLVNPNMRERRFGIMRRMIQVPAYTRTQDVSATLKNGVLTLRIDCGMPFEQDDEQEVPVNIE